MKRDGAITELELFAIRHTDDFGACAKPALKQPHRGGRAIIKLTSLSRMIAVRMSNERDFDATGWVDVKAAGFAEQAFVGEFNHACFLDDDIKRHEEKEEAHCCRALLLHARNSCVR